MIIDKTQNNDSDTEDKKTHKVDKDKSTKIRKMTTTSKMQIRWKAKAQKIQKQVMKVPTKMIMIQTKRHHLIIMLQTNLIHKS